MLKPMTHLLMSYPIFLNFLMIFLLMMPSKNKFHPISMMIILILLTFLISIQMNFLYYSMIPFILFLAMIGGLMIIFMYITSLTNNEFFFIDLKKILMSLLKISPLIAILYLYINYNYSFNFYSYFNIQDSWKINFFNHMYDQINLNLLYNEMNNKTSMFIMLYIYFSMICIMNICYKLKAPLRQLMY